MVVCDKCAKIFLFVVNVAIWIVGSVFLGIGIWIAVSPSTFVKEALRVMNILSINDQQITKLAEQLLSSSMLLIGAYIMIAIGAFLFVVGFCGCWGACRENKCLLIIYIVFCSISFLFTLAIGIINAVYLNQIESLMTQGFKDIQVQHFDGNLASSDILSLTWSAVMQAKKCCGVYGSNDFTTNANTMAPKWLSSKTSTDVYPLACCTQGSTQCVSGPPTGTLFAVNCQTEFISPFAGFIRQYAIILTAVAFSLSLFCLLSIVAAVLAMNSCCGF